MRGCSGKERLRFVFARGCLLSAGKMPRPSWRLWRCSGRAWRCGGRERFCHAAGRPSGGGSALPVVAGDDAVWLVGTERGTAQEETVRPVSAVQAARRRAGKGKRGSQLNTRTSAGGRDMPCFVRVSGRPETVCRVPCAVWFAVCRVGRSETGVRRQGSGGREVEAGVRWLPARSAEEAGAVLADAVSLSPMFSYLCTLASRSRSGRGGA